MGQMSSQNATPVLSVVVGDITKDSLGRLRIVLALVLMLAVGIASGIWLDRATVSVRAVAGSTLPAGPDLPLITQAWDVIQKNYVDHAAAQPQKLTYGAVSGMVDALGDTGHSRFLSPEMVKVERNMTQGEFEGIGVEVQTKDDHLVVVAPIDGTPAQKAGLRPGDIILKVNGQDISGLPLEQAIGLILGPAGTSVTLTIANPDNGQMREVTLTRARIALHNVTWIPVPGTTIAHVRVAAFSQGVSKELAQVLQDIRQQGMTGVILDLRNDPGGLLDEAIGVTSQFLGSGTVLLEKNAKGEVKPVPVKSGGVATDMPLVVLINGGTASAAEITAGALQDAQRAQLVGETTFGTGTVLNEFNLSDGSAMLLATEEWLTPAGRVIWHHGISPDVKVGLDQTATLLSPETEKEMTLSQWRTAHDDQLQRGLDLLTTSLPEQTGVK
jgi:carboxyl-terminal processing protease